MATKYGTVANNILTFAPRAIIVNGAMVTNPKAEHFAALNVARAKEGKPPYLEVVDTPPQTDAAHYAVATGWTRDGDTWRRVYEVRELPPPPPRTFSKLRIVAALMDAGVWAQVKAYIESAGLYDLYLAAQEFAEDNQYFKDGKDALQTALGWSDEQVEEVLAGCVK